MKFHNSVEQSGQFLSGGAGRAAITYEMEMLRPRASLKVGVQAAVPCALADGKMRSCRLRFGCWLYSSAALLLRLSCGTHRRRHFSIERLARCWEMVDDGRDCWPLTPAAAINVAVLGGHLGDKCGAMEPAVWCFCKDGDDDDAVGGARAALKVI